MKSFKGKNILVYGIGDSGRAVCKILHSYGACISIFDDNEKFCNEFYFEKDPYSKRYDLIILSPGIKVIGNKLIEHFKKTNQRIISELDFGYSFLSGKLIGITGTNGKTTTCMLVGKILSMSSKKTNVCGNIGLPLSSIAVNTKRDNYTVCEVSNFQLETSNIFSPEIACILNITEDHIDRHETFDEYKRVKFKLINLIKRRGKIVLNFDDRNILDYIDKKEKLKNVLFNSKKITFFSKKTLKNGIFVQNEAIFYNNKKVIELKDVKLKGDKNLENILASVAIACALKININTISEAIKNFKPASHRLEEVAILEDVLYVDDSKATNVDCILNAISAYRDKPIILMVGGRNKNCDFSVLFKQNLRIKSVVCFGEAGSDIGIISESFGYKTQIAKTMKEGFLIARKVASSGDVVLLSPGCSSFDEFENYAHRGEVFKSLVLENNEKN